MMLLINPLRPKIPICYSIYILNKPNITHPLTFRRKSLTKKTNKKTINVSSIIVKKQ